MTRVLVRLLGSDSLSVVKSLRTNVYVLIVLLHCCPSGLTTTFNKCTILNNHVSSVNQLFVVNVEQRN